MVAWLELYHFERQLMYYDDVDEYDVELMEEYEWMKSDFQWKFYQLRMQ